MLWKVRPKSQNVGRGMTGKLMKISLNVFKGKKPESKTTASKDMLEVGKMLAILNQMAVFTDASNQIVEEFGSFVRNIAIL